MALYNTPSDVHQLTFASPSCRDWLTHKIAKALAYGLCLGAIHAADIHASMGDVNNVERKSNAVREELKAAQEEFDALREEGNNLGDQRDNLGVESGTAGLLNKLIEQIVSLKQSLCKGSSVPVLFVIGLIIIACAVGFWRYRSKRKSKKPARPSSTKAKRGGAKG